MPRVLWWIICAIVGPAIAWAAVAVLGQWLFVSHRVSHEYRFDLPGSPAFLTEAVALEKAKATLSADGYDVTKWAAEEDNRTRAPDGTPDIFLARNSLNPKRGTIQFHKQDDWTAGNVVPRLVSIELRDSSVVCEVIKPK